MQSNSNIVKYKTLKLHVGFSKNDGFLNPCETVLSGNIEEAIEVMTDLSVQAKQAGTSISNLTKIAKNFDTFKEGADFVALLNGTIGTNLSSVDLMSMKYDDRMRTIKESIIGAVGSFDDLDDATQLFIASQIASGDLALARRMLREETEAEKQERIEAEQSIVRK